MIVCRIASRDIGGGNEMKNVNILLQTAPCPIKRRQLAQDAPLAPISCSLVRDLVHAHTTRSTITVTLNLAHSTLVPYVSYM